MCPFKVFNRLFSLRIEASNRVAMSKMFERVEHEDSTYKQEFLPKLADAIAYSTIKEKNVDNISKYQDLRQDVLSDRRQSINSWARVFLLRIGLITLAHTIRVLDLSKTIDQHFPALGSNCALRYHIYLLNAQVNFFL
jgi:hypothetical protein